MKLNFVLSLLFLTLLFPSELFAQPQLWEIYSTSNQPFVNVIVKKYSSDSLYLNSMNNSFILHQDSIAYLIRKRESNFGLGFLFGAAAGGIFGATTSSNSDGLFTELGNGLSVVLGVVLGGVIGGIFGLAAGSDEKYQVGKLKPEAKRKLLDRLFN
jgi:hypothetical protein